MNDDNKALLIVDLQVDFCPGGALAVPGGDEIVPVVNEYIDLFNGSGYPIIASRDWHPEKTEHFKGHGGTWPPHCVKDTEGARFAEGLLLPESVVVVSKGTSFKGDSYSAFLGKTGKGKPLDELLRELGVKTLYVCGLATDFCVKRSALDAKKRDLEVYFLEDASEGIDPEGVKNAMNEMRDEGIQITDIGKLKKESGGI